MIILIPNKSVFKICKYATIVVRLAMSNKKINVWVVLYNLNVYLNNFSVIVLTDTLTVISHSAMYAILNVNYANIFSIIVYNVIKIISDIYQQINAFV